ncbi:MAG: hypothetical protein RIE74_09430 [Pseudomonadales bacterium]
MVLNKIDALPSGTPVPGGPDDVAVSARSGAGLEALVAAVGRQLGVSAPTEVHLAAADGGTRAWLYGIGAVLDEQVHEDGSLSLTVQADSQLLARLARRPSPRADGFVAPPVGHP